MRASMVDLRGDVVKLRGRDPVFMNHDSGTQLARRQRRERRTSMVAAQGGDNVAGRSSSATTSQPCSWGQIAGHGILGSGKAACRNIHT
ncbi:hypothetical protein [Nocardia iowensis]|uniref:Uncharacterized protein n=1 Tax=Nocardia iowensis TaxID=204891 RepID=A0ABX8S687_NOCIO|nr:hypothetical protein [Nocardia iowensis]QXN96135.1 hypothetical protein KV110_24135 [Nocardia iowensis]